MPGLLVDKKLLDDDPSDDSSEDSSEEESSEEESSEEEDSDDDVEDGAGNIMGMYRIGNPGMMVRPREPPRGPPRQEPMADMMTELVNMRKDMADIKRETVSIKTMIKEIHLMVEALAINRGINVTEVLAQRPVGPNPGPTTDAPADVATTTNAASQPQYNSSSITTAAVDTPMPDAAAS